MADSIWKKELSLGRRKPAEDAAPAAAAPPAEAASKQSIWKKELGRPKQPKQPQAEKVAAPKGEGGSLWKKELSFGRKRNGQTEDPAPLEAIAVAPVEPPPAVAPAPPVIAAPVDPALAPVLADEYNWLTAGFDPNAPASPAAPVVSAPAVSLEAAPLSAASAPPEPAAPVLAPALSALSDTPAPAIPVPTLGPGAPPAVELPPLPPAADAAPPVAAPPSIPAAPVFSPPAPLPAPAPAGVPPPMSAIPAAPAMPGIAFTPPAPPAPAAPVAPPAPEAAAPPVPAEPVAEAATEVKTPFWKKDLSVGRNAADRDAKAERPKRVKLGRAQKAPQEKKEKKEKKAAATPFWKRDLSSGGKTKATGAEATAKRQGSGKAMSSKATKNHAKQTLVGLKIGASQIAAAKVANNGSPQLIQLVHEPLPDGIVVGGELRDFEGLAQALKLFFDKHKLPKKGVRLGIANNRIGVRTFDITGIEDTKQLANAIRFRAQETLPIPLEEAVLDWQVLGQTTDPETGEVTRRVLLVVAYRELVDRYVDACKQAGIRLAGIDLEAFAMLRALSPPLPGEAPQALGAQVVVNVGHDRSTFAVSDGRVCEFTRVLGWGGSQFSVAIARALDLAPSEAAPIKHALSLVAETEPPEGVTAETMGLARDALRRELQSFARELVSSLRFYQNQPNSLGIGELIITGGTAHLPGFAEELERLIGVPVRVGDPFARVSVPKKLKLPDRVGSLTVAIGLGIED